MNLIFVTTVKEKFAEHFKGGYIGWVENERYTYAEVNSGKVFFVWQDAPESNALAIVSAIRASNIAGAVDIFIAEHESGGEVGAGYLKKNKSTASMVKFTHGTGEVYAAILGLCQSLGRGDAEGKFFQLCETIKKKPVLTRFATLKHSIGKLFLSLDIDIQAIALQDPAAAADYFARMLAGKQGPAAVKNLEVLAEKVNEFLISTAEGVGAGVSINPKAKECLLLLCGMNEKYALNEKSEIYKYMREWDSAVASKKYSEVTLSIKSGKINIKSFHDWFDALMVALDELNPNVGQGC
ncbi:MAG TPA: hypothetical protein DEQ77_04740 [Candidatus Omnitrophica bacterium]|nr:hypothetical protein [Candidatus Omnitrophota bacterium]